MTNLLSKITKLRVLRTFNGYEIIHICSRNNHWSKYSYLNGISSDPLKPYTIGGIFNDIVQQIPDREFVVSTHENKVYTYAAMNTEVDKMCRSFNAIGLRPGDRVAIWMPNYVLYFSIIIATARLGLILVNINPAYQSDELKHSLTLVGVKCLITLETFKTQNYPEILKRIDPDIFSQRSANSSIKSKVLPMLETVVLHSQNRINGTYDLESFFDLGSGKSYNIPNVQPDDGCNIQFTSGTTGKPKAALLNHFGLINNAYFIMKRIGIISDDHNTLHKICCPMPMFHAFALSAAVIGSIISQSTVYLPSAHYEPKITVDVITKEKCTLFFGTPTMYVDILSIFEKLSPELRDNALKLAITGGAPCSPDLMKKFKKTFPDAVLTSLFGMTETGPCSFQNRFDDTEEKILSTVGYIQEHVEAKVVDENGQMVPFGTPGELLIRGYLNMNSYFNDEVKTKATIDSNGWLHTGDQFVMYENGYGNHVGRIKELIIRGGENIYPKEIEYFLESHPQITQAQVYGVPDKRMGEEVCASISVKEDSEVTEADIKAYSKGKIAHFKIPKYIFIERGQLPLTASGKVQKFKLAEMARQRIALRSNSA